MGEDTNKEDDRQKDQTFWDSVFTTIKQSLKSSIKTVVINWIWEKTWDFLCGVLYQRSANRRSAQSLSDKQTTLQNALNELLELSGYSHLTLAQKVSKLTEKSTKIRTYLGKAGIWIYLNQCYRSKMDKKQLEGINREFDKMIKKSDERISSERSNQQTQQTITRALHAVSCRNRGVGTNPGGPLPLPVTDLKTWPDLDGSVVLKWEDAQNGLLGYEVCYDSFSHEYAPVFIDPSHQSICLNDLHVKPWMSYEPAVRAVNATKPGPWVQSTPSKVLNKSIPSTPPRPEIVGPTSNTSIEISVYCPKIQEISSCVVNGIGTSDLDHVPFTRMNGDFRIIELENLSPTSTYQVRLKFRNEYGISKTYSDELPVSMSSFIPGAPVSVSVSERSTDKACNIRWTTPSSNEDIVDSYEIEKMDESWVKIATVPASTYKYVASLPEFGAKPYFRLRSVASNRCVSEYSQVVQVKPPRPFIVGMIRILFFVDQIIFAWEHKYMVLFIYSIVGVFLFMQIGWVGLILPLMLLLYIYFVVIFSITVLIGVVCLYFLVFYIIARSCLHLYGMFTSTINSIIDRYCAVFYI